jgi:Sec-independent protein translocase protein TatA
MNYLLQPWHLVVFAVIAFLVFGTIGLLDQSQRKK